MTENTEMTQPWTRIELQPVDIRKISEKERNALIISAICVENRWVICSNYSDDRWRLTGRPRNTRKAHSYLDFHRVPVKFKAVMKAIAYRFLRRGRLGQPRPKGGTLINFFDNAVIFLRYLNSLNIDSFRTITSTVCFNYIATCREYRKKNGNPLQPVSLNHRFTAVEALYELSQHTDDPFQKHPWPDTSSAALAGLTNKGSYRKQGCKTPLIPDDIFCALFEEAFEKVKNSKALLDLRDTIAETSINWKAGKYAYHKKNILLSSLGWKGGITSLKKALIQLRTACYIVLASTSGCRNHELTNLMLGSHHRTRDNEGTLYHWMRSKSEKTGVGVQNWMIPEAAVRALRVMERWAKPYQAMIAEEIADRRRKNPLDPEIARAQMHCNALFLGRKNREPNRTISSLGCNVDLKSFAKDLGLNWVLTSHQFRRKFANYVAHSRFGDLRYLRVHFAHWSMDMALGYAMDESWGDHLDLDLFNEIQAEYEDIKLGTVDGWLSDGSLAGGYGRSLKQWQRDPTNLAIFKDHKTMVISIAESTFIRSNGHAWCTADNDGCVGNTLERTRCGDCNNAVIGPGHLGIYRQLYNNLKELLECRDIGESGRVRVLRDMDRCRSVFMQLGCDPEGKAG